MTKTCINYATWWKMPSSISNNGAQWQPVTPKGLLLSSPSARSGRWYFGLSYFDDTPRAGEQRGPGLSDQESGEWAFAAALLALCHQPQPGRERELRSSEANFRSVIDRNTDGIVIVDRQGVVRFLNPAAETILDRKLEEMLGETIGFPVLAEETTEINVVPRNGSIGWAEMRLVEIVWEGESSYLAALHDVTERREIDRMKDEFVSIVSHELRTPLTAIRGSLGLVQNWVKGTDLAKTERWVEIAVTNTDRLGRLINDFLDIERMESGQVAMEKRACDVADLIDQAADLMRDMAQNSGIALVTYPVPAYVWADPDRIMQILTNLIGNAIKFSSEGGTVELIAQLKGEQILFQVRDQGRGIPADKLETIFERFEQVDASDSRAKGGTGLGLAISRSIAAQHDGSIWAENVLGEGSAFFLTLPSLQEGRPEPADGVA